MIVHTVPLSGGQGLDLDIVGQLGQMPFAPGFPWRQGVSQFIVGHGAVGFHTGGEEVLQHDIYQTAVMVEKDQARFPDSLGFPKEIAPLQNLQQFLVALRRERLIYGLGALPIEVEIPLPEDFLGRQPGI